MRQTVPFPVNPRQMLSLFGFFDPAKGLASVMNRVRYEDLHRRQIMAAVLGRIPENRMSLLDGPDFVARATVSSALNGQEFQTRIRELLLNAYPEKKRLIYVHIPKCAGTDLLAGLRSQMPMLHHHLALPHMTNKTELFTTLRDLVIGLQFSDRIAVSGHVHLRWYREKNLIRFEDDLFTVVREPRSLIYSYISFILTRLKTYVGQKRGDTTAWLAGIGMTEIDPNPSAAYLAEIGSRLLRAPSVTTRNMICNNIGRGDVASTLDAMVMTDIEVTDVKRYSDWKLQRYGIPKETRVNESEPLFTPEIATAADRAFIDEIVAEDILVYERITKKLAENSALSVKGSQFA